MQLQNEHYMQTPYTKRKILVEIHITLNTIKHKIYIQLREDFW